MKMVIRLCIRLQLFVCVYVCVDLMIFYTERKTIPNIKLVSKESYLIGTVLLFVILLLCSQTIPRAHTQTNSLTEPVNVNVHIHRHTHTQSITKRN